MHDHLQTAVEEPLSTNNATAEAGAKRGPKFRNPEKPYETWTGRGRRPRWLKAELALGRTLEQFRCS